MSGKENEIRKGRDISKNRTEENRTRKSSKQGSSGNTINPNNKGHSTNNNGEVMTILFVGKYKKASVFRVARNEEGKRRAFLRGGGRGSGSCRGLRSQCGPPEKWCCENKKTRRIFRRTYEPRGEERVRREKKTFGWPPSN